MDREQERRLIERARRGDQGALDRLLEDCEPRLREFVRALGVHNKDRDPLISDIARTAGERLGHDPQAETQDGSQAAGEKPGKDPKAERFDDSRASFCTWLTLCVAKEQAFAQLVKLYPRHPRGALRVLGVYDQDLDDVTQDTWRMGWEYLRKCPQEGGYDHQQAGLYTWLTKCIAPRQALAWRDRKRQEHRAKHRASEQALLSADSAPPVDPSDIVWLTMLAYDELLRITFLCGGSPHKQLAFGYSKLIHGKASPRAIEGDAQEVDRRYGAERLPALAERFPGCYEAEGGVISSERVKNLMAPLRQRLRLTIGELVRPLSEHLSAVSGKVASDTCLREYYGSQALPGRPANHPISYWCDDVRRKVARTLGCDGIGLSQIPIEVLARESKHHKTPPRGCRECRLPRVPQCDSDADSEKGSAPTYV